MAKQLKATALRVHTDDELTQETSDLYRLLVDRVQDYAIFALDPRGYILSWNTGAERLKLYTAEEAIGKHFSMFYGRDDLAAKIPQTELVDARRDGRVEAEGWRFRKDGTRFWANVLITALRNDRGTLVGFAKVTRDLTERHAAHDRAIEDANRIVRQEAARSAAERSAMELKSLTDQLRAQAAELERRTVEAESANRAKSQFLAAMSHELRTPLNAIGGYSQLLQMGVSGPVTEEQKEQLTRILRSQHHLLSIINDILNYSRMEAGQVSYEITAVPLHEVVDSVAPMVALQAHAKRQHLKIGACSLSLAARADRAKVEQILINLLTNAVKFTPEGGEAELTCGNTGDVVWVRLRDTGIGIAEEQLESIFAPFVQVGRGLATPKEGAGLGLAISRDLARAMQGDLTVESREGNGSTFTLTLPRIDAKAT